MQTRLRCKCSKNQVERLKVRLMWLYRTGRNGQPMVLFDSQTTRASKNAVRFLAGFKEYLHVDGYAGYMLSPM